MPTVNGVGEPCAGEPHARFEVAGAGNGVARSAICESRVGAQGCHPNDLIETQPIDKQLPRQRSTLHEKA